MGAYQQFVKTHYHDKQFAGMTPTATIKAVAALWRKSGKGGAVSGGSKSGGAISGGSKSGGSVRGGSKSGGAVSGGTMEEYYAQQARKMGIDPSPANGFPSGGKIKAKKPRKTKAGAVSAGSTSGGNFLGDLFNNIF